jgi:FADH2 O2-dependent halogenase
LARYEAETLGELDTTAELVGALYEVMDDFESFRALSLLYFAAASYSETVRRLGRPMMANGFLLRGIPDFHERMRACCRMAARQASTEASRSARGDFLAAIRRCVEPVDLVGLCRPDRQHWYPVDLAELYKSSAKAGASAEEIREMLKRCGMSVD